MMKRNILSFGFLLTILTAQAQATLPTFWSFVNPSPSGVTVSDPNAPIVTYPAKQGWTTKLDISVNGTTPFVYATGSDGNAACRFDGTGEFLQINVADKPGQLSYYLRGTGIGTPSFTGVFDVQQSVDGLSWNTIRSFTTANPPTGGFVRYTATPALTSRFIRFFYTTKESGTNIALDSVYIRAAPAITTPTIQVFRNNIAIANNTQNIVGNTLNFSFKVKNLGLIDTLVIDSINFTGSNFSSYGVSNTFPIKIAANDSTTINCTLDTSGSGSRFATINIYNNDLDKKQFSINLYGIAGNIATEPSSNPPFLTLVNVTSYGMNVLVDDTVPANENYLVLRKMGTSISDVPVDGVTYQKGDYIGSSQVVYIGRVGSFKPTYILANTDYTFTLFAFNGPSGFENYLTTGQKSKSVKTPNSNPGSYYNAIDPNKLTFISDLSAKVNPHDTIFYSNYTATVINNFLTRDTTLGRKVVNCVYTGVPYIYNEPFVWQVSGGTGILTREHTRAQSTMPTFVSGMQDWERRFGGELPEYNDLHNLFPADQINANGPRSNNPFGECVTVTSTSPTGKGRLGKDANNNTVYEPKDEQKGDLARALFYMSVCYNGIRGNNWSLPANQGLAVLLKWHQQDPPSAEEIARHEYIASVQKNRNPFIDNPNWANLIDFKTMNLVPGKNLVVNAPNGGETLLAGKTVNITWLATSITTKVKLEYTTNGTDFIFIDSVNASPASYTWTIPAVATTTAKIRISATDNSINDVSNANFTINVASLKLLTPVSTDVWKGNENRNVTWQSDFVDSITIELFDGNTLLSTVKAKASAATYPMAVPNIVANSANIVLKEINGTLLDKSGLFKIEKSVSVKEISANNFVVYPNPNNGVLHIRTDLNLRNASYQLIDITGKEIQRGHLEKTNTLYIADKGMYVLKMSNNSQTIIKKIIVE